MVCRVSIAKTKFMRKEELTYLEKICQTGVYTLLISDKREMPVVITVKLVTFFVNGDKICYFK